MAETILYILLNLKEGKYNEEVAAKLITELLENDGKLAIAFAEWIGTNFEQDNGSVIGNVYYDRVTREDFNITQLWDKFKIPDELNN